MNLFYDNIFLIPGIAFIIASFYKWLAVKLSTWRKLRFSDFFWSWGMPSWHSAITTSLTTAIAIKNGIYSDEFAIAISFTVIIIYDAINIRHEAGKHAEAINEIIWKKKFNESLGHLPSEVFVGSLVGIATALILWYI
jgi:acid phosphatase family membrane protein YuiD